MFDASCSFAIEVQILLFMMKCVTGRGERVKGSEPTPIFAAVFSIFPELERGPKLPRPRHHSFETETS